MPIQNQPDQISGKTAFIFHSSYWEMLLNLSEDLRERVALTIIAYGVGDDNSKKETMSQCSEEELFILRRIFSNIDKQQVKYKNVEYIDAFIKNIEIKHLLSEANNDACCSELRRLKNQARKEEIDHIRERCGAILYHYLSQDGVELSGRWLSYNIDNIVTKLLSSPEIPSDTKMKLKDLTVKYKQEFAKCIREGCS